jgi:hypothetical protein
LNEDLIRDFSQLQQRVDGLVKPEFALGLSLISETILTGSVASVTFASIPQTFRTLRLFLQLRSDQAVEAESVILRFNADSGNNYDWIQHYYNTGTGSAGSVTRATSSIALGLCEAANSRASNFSPINLLVSGYATAGEKWVSNSLSAVFGDVSADADMYTIQIFGRWRSTAAITSVTILPATGPNFVSGSILQLYGVQ